MNSSFFNAMVATAECALFLESKKINYLSSTLSSHFILLGSEMYSTKLISKFVLLSTSEVFNLCSCYFPRRTQHYLSLNCNEVVIKEHLILKILESRIFEPSTKAWLRNRRSVGLKGAPIKCVLRVSQESKKWLN